MTEIVSKRLSTCTADRLNRCFKSTSACIESPYLETTENSYLYFTPGVVKSRDLTCPITACQANCNHRRTCVVSKCVVVWKTVPFHDEKLMKNTLFIPETMLFFLVSILKISLITSLRTRKVFYYVQRLFDVVATPRSNDAKCSVAFLENKRRKIS